MTPDNMIAALKRERAGYVARGLDDRVRQVDEQLEHYRSELAESGEQDGPQGRTAPPQERADSKAPAKKAAAKKTAPPPQK